mmetsp:Transcript_49561/g.49939  ORF Transcript_49561/g.49939 Transcript_49561/m.49939 type:complete len:88 (+) Transcript_49561:12-275(+)
MSCTLMYYDFVSINSLPLPHMTVARNPGWTTDTEIPNPLNSNRRELNFPSTTVVEATVARETCQRARDTRDGTGQHDPCKAFFFFQK